MATAERKVTPAARATQDRGGAEAALQRLNASLDAAQDAAKSLRKDVRRGTRDIARDVERMIAATRKDAGKLAKAVTADLAELQQAVTAPPPGTRAKTGPARARGASPRTRQTATTKKPSSTA